MKIVNPFGKSVNTGDFSSVDPRGCMCSSGSAAHRREANSCHVCKCQCSEGMPNQQANFGKATAVVRY